MKVMAICREFKEGIGLFQYSKEWPFKKNVVYSVDVKKARHPEHHNKYWGLCALVADSSDFFRDAEHVSDFFKVKVGLVDVLQEDKNDNVIKVVVKIKSIAWENMDQHEFQEFYSSFEEWSAKELKCSVLDIKENNIWR